MPSVIDPIESSMNRQVSIDMSGRLTALARDIKLSHSVFAMPFALLATFLAAAHEGRYPSVAAVCLIVLCMVLGRTVAMAVNRWADGSLDRLNPRTTQRAIPSGRLTSGFMLGTAIVCATAFVVATAGFWVLDDNPYPLAFSPLVLVWLGLYSFTKRWTWLCHLFLGSALAISPLAAGLAVGPKWLSTPGPYLLASMVLFWVAGFDVIYALQDVEPDRQIGVYSIPARLGVERALWISRGMHALAVVALLGTWLSTPQLGTGFMVGCGVVMTLLIVEHILVWGSKTHHIHMAFFTVNGAISVLLGLLGIVDVVCAVG